MTHVNGLPLPLSLLRLIESGRWIMPADQRLLARYFSDLAPPDLHISPRLYSPEEMETETRHWMNMVPHPIDSTGAFAGAVPLSTIVLIGDMGVGWDAPLAMHFANSESSPVVLHLTWNGGVCHWAEIFTDIDSLATALQL